MYNFQPIFTRKLQLTINSNPTKRLFDRHLSDQKNKKKKLKKNQIRSETRILNCFHNQNYIIYRVKSDEVKEINVKKSDINTKINQKSEILSLICSSQN